ALHDGGKVQYGKRHAGQISHGGKAPGSHDNKAPEAGRLCNIRTVYRRLRYRERSTALLIRSIGTANRRRSMHGRVAVRGQARNRHAEAAVSRLKARAWQERGTLFDLASSRAVRACGAGLGQGNVETVL